MNPVDSLSLAQAAAERSFDCWGTLLVWATILVMVGLLVEYLPDFSERIEHSRWRKWFVIPGAVAVTLGVASEGFVEYKVLRTEGTLRSITHQKDDELNLAVANANSRARGAESRAATALTELTVVATPRTIGILDPQINSLKAFAGSPLFVQNIEETEPKHLSRELLNVIQSVGWRTSKIVTQTETGISPSDIPAAITIWTIRPQTLISTSPERMAGIRASKLNEYIGANGVLSVWHDVGIDRGNPIWPFNRLKPAAPRNAILVLIGIRDTGMEIQEWRAGSLPLPPWSGP
jgi:hypothetical protein